MFILYIKYLNNYYKIIRCWNSYYRISRSWSRCRYSFWFFNTYSNLIKITAFIFILLIYYLVGLINKLFIIKNLLFGIRKILFIGGFLSIIGLSINES